MDEEENAVGTGQIETTETNAEDEKNEFKLSEREFDENELSAEQTKRKSELNEENDNSDEPPEIDPQWQNQAKHVFVLSEAGKPIYTL